MSDSIQGLCRLCGSGIHASHQGEIATNTPERDGHGRDEAKRLFRDSRNETRSSNSAGFNVAPNAGMFTPPLAIRMVMSFLVSLSPT